MHKGDYVPFTKKLHEFLANEMCIDVHDLIEKINEPKCNAHLNDLYKIIGEFSAALHGEKAEKEIQRIFLNYEHLFDHEAAYAIIDPLRHAFDGFAYGGLHQLYTRQENETWYPKIILTRELKPNDIASLNEFVTIYRGCSANEHASKTYGQSWSTSKYIAELFAHVHYQNYPWFNSKIRVVLQSTIPKSAIFYSKQYGEFEVAVDVRCLHEIEVCA